jgi:hypothetical protein
LSQPFDRHRGGHTLQLRRSLAKRGFVGFSELRVVVADNGDVIDLRGRRNLPEVCLILRCQRSNNNSKS